MYLLTVSPNVNILKLFKNGFGYNRLLTLINLALFFAHVPF